MIDIALSAMWLAVLAYVSYAVWPRARPRHRWGELDSSDVVTAIRRVRRPR